MPEEAGGGRIDLVLVFEEPSGFTTAEERAKANVCVHILKNGTYERLLW